MGIVKLPLTNEPPLIERRRHTPLARVHRHRSTCRCRPGTQQRRSSSRRQGGWGGGKGASRGRVAAWGGREPKRKEGTEEGACGQVEFTESAGRGGICTSLERPGALLLYQARRRPLSQRAGPPASATASHARPRSQPLFMTYGWGASAKSPACGTGYGRVPPHVGELRGRHPAIPFREGLSSSR